MKHFTLVLSLGVFSYIFIFQITQLFAVEPYRSSCHQSGDFRPGQQGYSLSVSILSTQQVTKHVDCAFTCMKHETCKSFNYQQESSGSTHTCELLDKIKAESSGSYISRPGYIHYEPFGVLCRTLNCQNGGICKEDCNGHAYCVCPQNLTGESCNIDGRVYTSCDEVKQLQRTTAPGHGFFISIASKVIEVFCLDGWMLIARFSNADEKNWMADDGGFWYTKETPYGDPRRPDINEDMLSEAFWLVQANQFRITITNDTEHLPLLITTSSCLGGKTFRGKISSYGKASGTTSWASNACQTACTVTYFNNYATVSGFSQSACDGSIQSRNNIGFFCQYGAGDGSVLMIGGGGDGCDRSDHGIGITETNDGAFEGVTISEYDFGNDAINAETVNYALNLWILF